MTKIRIEKQKLLEMISDIIEKKSLSETEEVVEASPTIEMTKTELKEMVNSILENGGGMTTLGIKKNPIMAKREIIAMMDSTSRSFEREILKTFNLRDPDELSPELQKRYLEIVEAMKSKLVAAAMEAVQQLISFPSNEQSK